MKRLRIRWTDKLVIEAIRSRHSAGLPLNYQAIVQDDEKLAGAARRHFGSWDAALAAAGYDPAAIRRPRGEAVPRGTWTPEVIIEQIQADVIAGLEISAHAAQKRSPSLVARGQQLFGSWEAAVTEAGYDYEAVRKTKAWSPEQVTERIQELARLGADLSDKTCAAYDASLYGAAQLHYGSWPNALEAAGIDPDGARRTVRWSRAKILSAIAHGRRDAGLVSAAIDEFGTWNDARRAAGILDEPEQTVVNCIRTRRTKLGLSPKALGARIGVSGTMVRHWETGKRPDPRVSMALRIAQALNCRVEDLYGADPEKPASQNDAGAPVENPPD